MQSAWEKVLDTRELNKRFYQDLFNWYTWAIDHVQFPIELNIEMNSNGDSKEARNATSLIRLITRVIFVWFLREKKLVNEVLFNREGLKQILQGFNESNDSSNYYNAILQNLFFGALNQPPLDRKFEPINSRSAWEVDSRKNSYFRFRSLFCLNESNPLRLFSEVPFLNGGLFECLDSFGLEGSSRIVDGFSEKPNERTVIPDFLFFRDDLDRRQGTRSRSGGETSSKHDGLFTILDRYKFTITENTPIEEEVALDPELLGQVFENLLAAYVGETKESARKQAGTFYTPRTIVEKMVDDCLVRFLRKKLIDSGEGDQENTLQQLVQYSENREDFTNRQKELILRSISECKILDPACGSGAFSIGILNKLVLIFTKLDGENKVLSSLQSPKFRENIDVLDEEKIEYSRKLFLIENCIFGIDKEPIAVQIARLRVFITLIIDQQRNEEANDNYGIRTLPNLEMKFVVANTLRDLKSTIGGDLGIKPSFLLSKTDHEHNVLFEQKIQDYFYERDHEKKLGLQENIRNIQLRHVAEMYMSPKDLPMALTFDSFDASKISSGFNASIMFGPKLSEGFDIIIGNPPWGARLTLEEKRYYKSRYPKIDSSSANSLAYFIGWALENYKCLISFVVSDNLLTKDFPRTRKYILPFISKIDWYENTGLPMDKKPFPHIGHDVCIITMEKEETETLYYSKNQLEGLNSTPVTNSIAKSRLAKEEFVFNLLIEDIDFKILERIEAFPEIGTFMECHEGIHSGAIRKVLFHRQKVNDQCKPLFLGSGSGDVIANYYSTPDDWFVDLSQESLNRLKLEHGRIVHFEWFNSPKIYLTRTGDPVRGFLDIDNYASNNFFSLQPNKVQTQDTIELLQYVLPFVISPIAQYFYRTFASPRLGRRFVETKIKHILRFRIPRDCKEREVLVALVRYVTKLRMNNFDSRFFEKLINAMIYGIYFPDVVKKAGAFVFEHLQFELEVAYSLDKSISEIREFSMKLSDSNNPITIAMAKLDTINFIRTIEERR